MSPEETKEINREIAEWLDGDARKTCTKCLCNRFITPCTYDCPEYKPTNFYTFDAYAYTLLPVLLERGFWYQLNGVRENHSCEIGIVPRCEMYISLVQPTISAAICNALIQVIRKEKKK